MASEKSLNKKKAEVTELAEKMKNSKLILLTSYRGINVVDDTELRKELREEGASCSVVKNNILKRALKENKLDEVADSFDGPTALVMSDDYLGASKIIYNFMKSHDFYQIKGGVIDGKVMSAEEIITLAKLPSREDLLSMLAGALLANISKVAVALNEVKKKKEQEGEKVEVATSEDSNEAKTEEK